jgi:hypothetical protein
MLRGTRALQEAAWTSGGSLERTMTTQEMVDSVIQCTHTLSRAAAKAASNASHYKACGNSYMASRWEAAERVVRKHLREFHRRG